MTQHILKHNSQQSDSTQSTDHSETHNKLTTNSAKTTNSVTRTNRTTTAEQQQNSEIQQRKLSNAKNGAELESQTKNNTHIKDELTQQNMGGKEGFAAIKRWKRRAGMRTLQRRQQTQRRRDIDGFCSLLLINERRRNWAGFVGERLRRRLGQRWNEEEEMVCVCVIK